jgi:hypothetical protein
MYNTPAEQKKLRIRLAVFAWAYENYNKSFIDDHTYDSLSRKVDLSIPTDRKNLDKWFASNFNPDTGMWIHNHPELGGIDQIVEGMLNYKRACLK